MIFDLSGKKVHIKDFTLTEKEFIKMFEKLKPWRTMADKHRNNALKADYKTYAKNKHSKAQL